MDPLISISGLSHTFGTLDAQRTVLDQVSLEFFPGEIVIIMGPSGAGKTTLLTLVGGLRSVQVGSVRVGGLELRGASPRILRDVRRRIGFIFQAHNLVASLTARENVQLALATDPDVSIRSSRERALELLSLVGLQEHADKLPHQLSVGQKQRIAVARALLRSPEIILADEPTSALDGQSGRAIVGLLEHLARRIGCAVLLVTHDSRILDIADRILTLEDGRVDETNLRMNRLAAEVGGLLKLLAGYPQGFQDADRMASQVSEFQSRVPTLQGELATVAGQRSSFVSGRALRWMTILEHLRSLDENLQKFAATVDRAPAEAEELAQMMTVGLEFLLLTAADVANTPPHTDAALLSALTSDNGESVNGIRDGYLRLVAHLTDGSGNVIFELATLYLRVAFFLHKIGGLLEQEGLG